MFEVRRFDPLVKGQTPRLDADDIFFAVLPILQKPTRPTSFLARKSYVDAGNHILPLFRGRCPRGEVDLRHFAAYMEDRLASRAASPAERCRAVFGAFDAHRVGFITLTDALAAFALAAPRVPAVVVEDLFREADEDGDGRVGFDAFARVYFGADECPSPGRGR